MMTPDAIKNMIRKMLRDEGWGGNGQQFVVTIGPDCQPVLLEDCA